MVRLGTASVVLFAHFVQGWQGTDPRSGQELRFSPRFQLSIYSTGACRYRSRTKVLACVSSLGCIDVDMLVSE